MDVSFSKITLKINNLYEKMQVSFGQLSTSNNDVLSVEQAQNPVTINFNGDPQKLYTILMYDPNASTGPYLHYEVVNAPAGDISKGATVFPYVPPNPPAQTGVHNYIFLVLEQNRTRPEGLNTGGRAPFPLEALMRSAELKPVAQHIVRVPSAGSYVGPMTRARTRAQQQGYSNQKQWLNKETLPQAKDRAYCRCILKVAADQPQACNTERAWFETRQGEKCYNPYAVCHASVKGEAGQPECGDNYLFENIPDKELVGYASLNRISVPYPYNRERMLNNIYQWKGQKY